MIGISDTDKRAEKDKLREALESLRQERDAALNTFHSANKERLELRQENSRLREALEKKTVLLHGGTRLKLPEAQEALDAAMQIIEAVGTTGIYSRYQKAHEWMKRYYPAWA